MAWPRRTHSSIHHARWCELISTSTAKTRRIATSCTSPARRNECGPARPPRPLGSTYWWRGQGAVGLKANAGLCRAQCSDGTEFMFRACVDGDLIEINRRLLSDPEVRASFSLCWRFFWALNRPLCRSFSSDWCALTSVQVVFFSARTDQCSVYVRSRRRRATWASSCHGKRCERRSQRTDRSRMRL